ncbi:hypothetical protein IPZ69_16480 [Streptomyces olivochromogenes]|nr:hypothetical protein [Streptomyces olivochromogenes]
MTGRAARPAGAPRLHAGESGGLNEATCDIMANGLEFFAKHSTDVGGVSAGRSTATVPANLATA